MSNWNDAADGSTDGGVIPPPHQDGADLHEQKLDDHVEDVTPRKRQNKTTIYAVVAVVVVLVIVLLWGIVSRLSSAMGPETGRAVDVTSPVAKGDSVDIPGLGSVPQGGSLLEPAPAASAPNSGVVAAPGAPTSVEAMLPTTPGQLAQAKAAEIQAAQTPVQQSASAVVAAPPAAVTPTTSPQPAQPAVASKTDVDRLKADLDQRSHEVADLQEKLATCQKSTGATKVCTAATPKKSLAYAPPKKRVAVAKAAQDSEEIVEAPVKKARSKKGARAATSVAKQNVEAKSTTTAATENAPKEADRTLKRYRIYAIYPNTGDHQNAHLINQAGEPLIVRVGDPIGTAIVKRISADAWEVQTTEGVIH